MTKLICFDLWKTLTKEPYNLESYWLPVIKKYPEKVKITEIKKMVDEIPMKKPISIEEAVKEILFYFNIKDQPLVNQISERWKLSCDNVALFDDVIPIFKWLKQKGYLLGLITNTSQYGWQQVEEKYQLSSHFDVIAKSFELGMTKPQNDIFIYIESQTKINPKKIMMVGDSYKSDIRIPDSRGWSALQLIRKQKKGSQKQINKNYIKTLEEIKQFL